MREEKAISHEDRTLGTPPEVFQALEADAEQAGGSWAPPAGFEGSIGATMFDTPTSKDGTVTILLPREHLDSLSSQALVRIESRLDGRTYLGAVSEGPFAEPDGLRADSTPMVVTTVKGGLLMPRFHGRAQIELLGEHLESEVIVPPRRRPKPNSPVFPLSAERTADVLKTRGDLRLGLADGFDELVVGIPASNKNVLPRHTGVLGTTGGGKSTTVSGLVARAQSKGHAVILIDTEGEYCAIDQPTDDKNMLAELGRRGEAPSGVKDTDIYHLIGKDTANPTHPRLREFSLRFSELSPYAVQEILDLSDAQSERFFKAYDVTKIALEKMKIWPRTPKEKALQLEFDEFESGYPGMTLSHLYDLVKEITAIVNKDEESALLETSNFGSNRSALRQIIGAAKPPGNAISWRALLGRLGKLKRLGIFDSSTALSLNYQHLLSPGRVSIFDLSDTDSPQIRNLVIAELLRGVQNQQELNYREAVQRGEQPIPALVFIEEAHEFLSTQRIKRMQFLFEQVAKIARRGRKRWLGLIFITQLPQHLPDEVLGLINNWILHKISDAAVVNRLRRSIGGISEPLWNRLPSLAPGQAIVSFTSFARPLQISIDPTPCRLLMTV